MTVPAKETPRKATTKQPDSDDEGESNNDDNGESNNDDDNDDEDNGDATTANGGDDDDLESDRDSIFDGRFDDRGQPAADSAKKRKTVCKDSPPVSATACPMHCVCIMLCIRMLLRVLQLCCLGVSVCVWLSIRHGDDNADDNINYTSFMLELTTIMITSMFINTTMACLGLA